MCQAWLMTFQTYKTIMKNIDIDIEDNNQDNKNTPNIGAFESTVNTSFFCTNDRAFEKIDNIEILQSMTNQYENLSQTSEDSVIKKTIVIMLNNESFMNGIMEYYNIGIQDIFKILYQQYSGIFKGPYLKKIRGILEEKQYV